MCFKRLRRAILSKIFVEKVDNADLLHKKEFKNIMDEVTVNIVGCSCHGHIRAGSRGATADGGELRAEPTDTGLMHAQFRINPENVVSLIHIPTNIGKNI